MLVCGVWQIYEILIDGGLNIVGHLLSSQLSSWRRVAFVE
jgi:hypothetical protein